MHEAKEDNDLFFTCSLIEYIARKTKNSKKTIVNLLGEELITNIYALAEIYHAEPIEKVCDEIIARKNIPTGNYDIIATCTNRIPTHFEIGRTYQALIKRINSNSKEYVKTLMELLSSWILEKIDNYDSSLYYENISYLYACYQEGNVL